MSFTAIYNISTGLIRQKSIYQPQCIGLDCLSGEDFYLNCPLDATHIIDGEPVHIDPPPPTAEELLAKIREERNKPLAACDWTQLADVPLTEEQKTAWGNYRQALRDFPGTCDPANPVWPTMPQ